ncbi:replicative DNA helicase [Alphaproteobacteria bacterium]|nr:replicative DNA helicase [Alphaproteobacteria bacterium]GHS99240.1 replicative DNA helicase [Alphaproteobacteria bacterium]
MPQAKISDSAPIETPEPAPPLLSPLSAGEPIFANTSLAPNPSALLATSATHSPTSLENKPAPPEAVPHNLEAEQALLGALLLNNNVLENVGDFLKPEHFYSPVHGKIFRAIQFLRDKNYSADPITLKDFFQKDDALSEVGGASYLVDLANSVVSLMNTADYGVLIYDLFLRRELMKIAQETTDDCRNSDLEINAETIVEDVEKKLYSLVTLGQEAHSVVAFRDAITQAIESAEMAFQRDSHIVGVTTGFLDVDRWLGGLHKSDLLIIAGRPSMGKTALATNMAFNAAQTSLRNPQDGATVVFFSLEMSAEQLATRILASESGISSDKIRRGSIRKDDFPKFVEVSRTIHDLPLFIDDTPGLSLSTLRNRARRLKRQHNIGLIIIDYLQLVDASSRRNDNRVQEVSTITRALKTLAKELDVPVLALSQLSRAVEQRDDKRPQLSDLRESGSIEQDADVVMFIYREEYYELRKEPKEGTEEHAVWQKKMNGIYNQAELIIAKQRHGPVGIVKLFFDGQLTKFGNAAA